MLTIAQMKEYLANPEAFAAAAPAAAADAAPEAAANEEKKVEVEEEKEESDDDMVCTVLTQLPFCAYNLCRVSVYLTRSSPMVPASRLRRMNMHFIRHLVVLAQKRWKISCDAYLTHDPLLQLYGRNTRFIRCLGLLVRSGILWRGPHRFMWPRCDPRASSYWHSGFHIKL